MENIEVESTALALLENILLTYRVGTLKLSERRFLKGKKLELGSIIEHTDGKYKGTIGIVIGVLNGCIYVRYINHNHLGYILPIPYKTISYKEMIGKLEIKTIND